MEGDVLSSLLRGLLCSSRQAMDDPLHLGLTQRETPEERRLRKRVFMKDNIHWCAF